MRTACRRTQNQRATNRPVCRQDQFKSDFSLSGRPGGKKSPKPAEAIFSKSLRNRAEGNLDQVQAGQRFEIYPVSHLLPQSIVSNVINANTHPQAKLHATKIPLGLPQRRPLFLTALLLHDEKDKVRVAKISLKTSAFSLTFPKPDHNSGSQFDEQLIHRRGEWRN